jgi:hypothetical protein
LGNFSSIGLLLEAHWKCEAAQSNSDILGYFLLGQIVLYFHLNNNLNTWPVVGMLGFKSSQHSTAQHSTAQHSTAQLSTAQHSSAQHSTAQHFTDNFSSFGSLLVMLELSFTTVTSLSSVFPDRIMFMIRDNIRYLCYDRN